jgi:hypothetical protein
MQLSKYFTLENLTTTSRKVDNTPDTFSQGNLQRLAVILDMLYDQIGPIRVTSGYRSAALNADLSADHPVSNTSLHMHGMAADILPLNDSAENYFKKIAQSPLKNLLGEIINEADEQGVVHVSLPYEGGTGVLKYLKYGSYYRYTPDEVQALIHGYDFATSDSDFDSYAEAKDGSSLSMVAIAAVLGAAFLVTYVVIQTAQARKLAS